MKPDTHPNYKTLTVVCGCGNKFETNSTHEKGELKLEVCNQCHPFFTGKHKLVDSAGNVERFNKRYGNYQSTQ